MAQYKDNNSMLRESLSEMVEIAYHCLENLKKEAGCPESGDRDKHFFVLNNKELFGLNLKKDSIITLYQEYRNMLFHENLINPGSKC